MICIFLINNRGGRGEGERREGGERRGGKGEERGEERGQDGDRDLEEIKRRKRKKAPSGSYLFRQSFDFCGMC